MDFLNRIFGKFSILYFLWGILQTDAHFLDRFQIYLPIIRSMNFKIYVEKMYQNSDCELKINITDL